MIGILAVPAARNWFLSQVEHHADHVTREFQHLVPDPAPVPPTPTVDPARTGASG